MSTCLITGASRGIGRAIAIKLSEREDFQNFVLLSRSQKGLEETKRLMNPKKRVDLYSVDVTRFEEIQKIVDQVIRDYGRIDYLLNVAGYAEPKSLLETTIDNWTQTYLINVHSLFFITREVVKHMKKTGGKILNVASTAGMSSRPGWLAYSSSKAAVISMSQTLSDELAEYGIKVYCISPGRCATELRRILAPDEDQSKIMQPEHVADVVNNLLSESGICLDGQNIVIRQQQQPKKKAEPSDAEPKKKAEDKAEEKLEKEITA
ncbi:3-oxoacyl-[acyl-carrier protein] reductase [Planifilum fimeticola]|jgi:NAD(P)-dependent dehydrogenase (short-subunit alcohol dehydrogenase family)|uniref:3-oxoacyl-[acyl-carrier protein] reductase n=1 Tax=Planifilum fimeticola TaxID=201975 RepID=A0A2T0LEJ7_9BACL|nr:SDR family oxidoreductase [Planifilum fimeticola]PRX40352.1 3-oxoacyl-[acyl-carrier protein] reductase [Planifilum fimeticola]